MSDKKIIYIDASSLKDCAGCLRKFYLNNLEGYQPINEKEYRMAYGTAFHLFAEKWYGGMEIKPAIELAVEYYSKHLENILFPEDEWRTPTHLVQVCKRYAAEYSPDLLVPLKNSDGKPLLEAKFSIPWFHTSTHEFIIAGTMDMIGTYCGETVICDHKTTATFYGNAELFLGKFELNIQPMMYCWIYKTVNKLDKAPPFLCNGIFLKKPTAKAAKEGVFDGVNFKRSSVIYYSNEQLDNFETWLTEWRRIMLWKLECGEMFENPNYAYCETPFGECKYFSVCKSPVECRSNILENSYTKKEYNPLKFKD